MPTGEKAKTPSVVPNKPNCNFLGWFKGHAAEKFNFTSEAVSEDLTLVARYTPQSFILHIEATANGTVKVVKTSAPSTTRNTGATLEAYSDLIITATADEGYELESMKVNGEDALNLQSKVENGLKFYTGNYTVQADEADGKVK